MFMYSFSTSGVIQAAGRCFGTLFVCMFLFFCFMLLCYFNKIIYCLLLLPSSSSHITLSGLIWKQDSS